MTLRAWAELLRVSALFTVPGDALAGAASAGVRPNRGTALAVGASLCMYEAGMALNDWADRDEDAVERPHRPIPSGRITPNAALAAAGGLTATGLLLASRAGRPALALTTALAATVWAYDLRLKHTAAGPAAMGAARALDVLLGATATASASRRTPTHRPSPPARRGVLARLSAWAGGPDGQGRTTPPVGAIASKLAGSAPRPALEPGASTARFPAPPGGPARHGRTTIQAGGPAEPLASRSAAPAPGHGWAALPTARSASPLPSAWAGGSAVSTSRTPPAPQGPLARLAAWADNSAAPRRPAAGNGWITPGGSTGRPAAPPGWRGGAPLYAVPRGALLPAALLGAHTVAVTGVSRGEVYGGSVGAPLAAFVVTGVLGGVVGRSRDQGVGALVSGGLAVAYALTAGRPFLHAALNPSPQLTQRAVGGGIRAMIPFQAALAARGGSPVVGLAVMALVPLARKFGKKVSVT
ncbi:UbiA family prenyltransferase [Streptomyces sp. NPDC051217]|uniref:UbiA family prenyltransferase n=1 Tax=Streptomyces sp. NPDC051217 TaxID=3365644 RepID=UPI0037A36CB8